MDTAEGNEAKKNFVLQGSSMEWNFKNELKKISKYKVSVVAKACLEYLKESIDFQIDFKKHSNICTNLILHPFSKEVQTTSSYSYKMFRNYCLNFEEIYAVRHQNTSNQKHVSRKEYELCMYFEFTQPSLKFQHAFSSVEGQKKFGPYDVDLYSAVSKTVIQFCGCYVYCHLPPECQDPKRQNLTSENCPQNAFLRTPGSVKKDQEKMCDYLLEKFPDEVVEIKIMYECRWEILKKKGDWKRFLEQSNINLQRPLHRLIPRIGMRGGLLDIYSLRWLKKEHPEEIFKIVDVNGLYGAVGMNFKFPVGLPKVIIGNDLKNVSVKNKQIFYKDDCVVSGMIFCSIVAPSNDLNPSLQFRINNQHNFLALCKSCTLTLNTRCGHKVPKSKAFTSTWTITDILKALKENYEIIEIFELHFFENQKFILKPFIQCLSSLRVKNSGGLDHLKSLNEKQTYCDNHNAAMELSSTFALNVNNVVNNPLKKALFKSYSNSIFGKFCQTSNTRSVIVHDQHTLESLATSHNILDIFAIDDTSLLVEYEEVNLKPDLNTNIYIGAEVTARGREVIHNFIRDLQTIPGVKIYSVDTDAIFYSIPKSATDCLLFSDLLGDFKMVVPSDCEILSFYALSTRNYCVLYQDSEKKLHSILKVKGLSLKSTHLKHPLNEQIYNDFIDSHFRNEIQSLTIPQIRKSVKKPSFHVETSYSTFDFKNDLYTKRFVDKNSCETFPYGYKK